jgi:hypothetical protein
MEKKNQGMGSASPETRKRVATLGGLTISKNKGHMARIGRKGGLSLSKDREHMARIGALGVLARSKKNNPT